MAEILNLTVSETAPATTTWRIARLCLDVDTPSIKVDLVSNTNKTFTWRLVPTTVVPASTIIQGLSFINQGKFKALQGKSLHRWLLDRMISDGIFAGTVSGIVD